MTKGLTDHQNETLKGLRADGWTLKGVLTRPHEEGENPDRPPVGPVRLVLARGDESLSVDVDERGRRAPVSMNPVHGPHEREFAG